MTIMTVKPSLDAAKELSRDYKIIPLSREIYSDIRTPVEVLKILTTIRRHCYMLESMDSTDTWGSYTFVGFDPTMEVTGIDGMLNRGLENKIAIKAVHPKDYIRQILEENKSPRFDYLPPFTGGLVGYFS